MQTPDIAAAPEPQRPPLSLDGRWLRAAAWLHAALRRRASADRAAGELAELLPWEDRRLLLAVLVAASAGEDGAELVDWTVEALALLGAPPEVRFGPLRAEAEGWAALASDAEIKVWLMACIARLPAAERLKFVAAVQRQAVAGAAA